MPSFDEFKEEYRKAREEQSDGEGPSGDFSGRVPLGVGLLAFGGAVLVLLILFG